eukprot:SAG31_NODE_29370_length_396_cov_0.976431_1_plen_34_part_10
MTACIGEDGKSQYYYEKPLDTNGNLGHGMGSREH